MATCILELHYYTSLKQFFPLQFKLYSYHKTCYIISTTCYPSSNLSLHEVAQDHICKGKVPLRHRRLNKHGLMSLKHRTVNR